MTTGEYNDCVKQHADGLYRFVLKSLKCGDTAKDVVQESFLRLWENRERVEGGKEKSYLFTIAYRLIVDNVRDGKRYVPDNEKPLRTMTGQHNGWNDTGEIVGRAVDELPQLQRKLVLLRDYEGYSYKEIGEITDLSEAQVKVYIFRARMTLKEKLGKLENILQ